MLVTSRVRGTAIAAATLVGAMAYLPASAAAPSLGPALAGAKPGTALVTQVQYRRGFRRFGGYGYRRGYGWRGRGWRGGAFIGGLAAGALLGGALSYPYYSGYSYYGSSYAYPSYGSYPRSYYSSGSWCY